MQSPPIIMVSNQIQAFSFSNTEIRTLTTPEGEVYFVASDVCKVLGLANSRQATSRLDEDEKDDVILNDTIGRANKFVIINESGLYSLVLSSKKPEAKTFKKWVTKEVLPTLRKTGKYEMHALDPNAKAVIEEAWAYYAERVQKMVYWVDAVFEQILDGTIQSQEKAYEDLFQTVGEFFADHDIRLTNAQVSDWTAKCKRISRTEGKMRGTYDQQVALFSPTVLQKALLMYRKP